MNQSFSTILKETNFEGKPPDHIMGGPALHPYHCRSAIGKAY